jgi:hypothetical protein
MVFTVVFALLLSAMAIMALGLQDPKRLRTGNHPREMMAPHRRRTLAAIACVPGLGCLLLGNTAAFLMWLGGCALFGWAIAGYFSGRTNVRRLSKA